MRNGTLHRPHQSLAPPRHCGGRGRRRFGANISDVAAAIASGGLGAIRDTDARRGQAYPCRSRRRAPLHLQGGVRDRTNRNDVLHDLRDQDQNNACRPNSQRSHSRHFFLESTCRDRTIASTTAWDRPASVACATSPHGRDRERGLENPAISLTKSAWRTGSGFVEHRRRWVFTVFRRRPAPLPSQAPRRLGRSRGGHAVRSPSACKTWRWPRARKAFESPPCAQLGRPRPRIAFQPDAGRRRLEA